MTDLSAVTADHFEPHVGTEFRLADDQRPALRLAQVNRRERRTGDREGFTLIFHDPGEECLPQQIHELRHDSLGEIAIFMVPVGRTADAWEYEAVFT